MRQNFKSTARAAIAVLALASFGPAFAQPTTPEPAPVAAVQAQTPAGLKGLEIARRSDRTDSGFGDSRVEAKMILRNAAGQETSRSFSFTTLEKASENEGDKSLVVFNSPKDVQGTALLSHAKILDPDDQWLYLPALKRVKRIASANKSGAFVGSEFSFEDFTITEVNKFAYVYLREEVVDGVKMDVVERVPLYEKSGYTRQISWIDQKDFQTRKVEFYDRKATLFKTLILSDYRQYGTIWRAHRLVMTSHQTKKVTELSYGTFTFKAGLTAADFEQGVLTRIR